MYFCIGVEDLEDYDLLGEKLLDLSGIVFRKHFYASYRDKDDLVSIGVLKALSLLDGGNFDERKGTLLNFLYTGMRNEMHNYLYHKNKKIKVGVEVSEYVEDIYFESDCFKVDFGCVREICKDFGFYGDFCLEVVRELGLRGFVLMDVDRNIYVSNSGINRDSSFTKEFLDDLVDRLCGAVIWKSREYSL